MFLPRSNKGAAFTAPSLSKGRAAEAGTGHARAVLELGFLGKAELRLDANRTIPVFPSGMAGRESISMNSST